MGEQAEAGPADELPHLHMARGATESLLPAAPGFESSSRGAAQPPSQPGPGEEKG